MRGRVLVVDDEKNMGVVIEAILLRAGFEVECFLDPKEAIEAISSEEFDAVITDLQMPGIGGMEVLAAVKRHQSQVPVVMITAFATVESAVSALKNGAFDFITKPFDQAELLATIEKACLTRHASLREPDGGSLDGNTYVPSPRTWDPFFLGTSDRIIALRDRVERVASTDSTILIRGESGTGKELLASEVHRHSKRSERPLIRVNCAVIPSALMEAELFGQERGVFSGASAGKPGRFELADEGTLFLDEVGEMPLEMQVKLLRAIGSQPGDQEFERVGGAATVRVNVRIIAATNRDLAAAVKAGTFREDLYLRLSVLPIELPELRERHEDFELLVTQLLATFNAKFGKRVQALEPEVFSAFRQYRWPGNIRQLENVLERMVLLSDSERISIRDLPEEFARYASGEELGFKELVRRQTQATERGLIEKALAETEGNVTHTAEKLGLSRKGLQLKMKELGIRR